MYKINRRTKNKLDSFLNILIIILIIFFNRTKMVLGVDNNWIEVSRTNLGIQYIDTNSLKNKDKGIIEITTKYLKIDANTSKEVENNIYIMRINCINNKFKDISINGTKNFNAKWEESNGDKLINDVISNSCKNV